MILAVIFLCLFKVFDELEQHSELSLFPDSWGIWWNKKESWKNKHIWGKGKGWLVSWSLKTWLVWITDAEHFFQMLKHIAVSLAFVSLIGWWVVVLFLAIVFTSFICNEWFLKLKFINKG